MATTPPTRRSRAGWRQGFVSNITNPKVLDFYIAVLPQFPHPGREPRVAARTGLEPCAPRAGLPLVLITGLHGMRHLLMRRRVRRTLDATTGAVLLGFGARLATEHV